MKKKNEINKDAQVGQTSDNFMYSTHTKKKFEFIIHCARTETKTYGVNLNVMTVLASDIQKRITKIKQQQ